MKWRKVGTVVGNAGTSEYTFILQHFQARVGDVVALRMETPAEDYESRSEIYVWARITAIGRFNPFFPFEAAQEIAGEGISLEDTVLSSTRDQLEAVALILGATRTSDLGSLEPLTYPVPPATSVFHPPADAVRQLLVGGTQQEIKVEIGTLIARADVEVSMSAARLVSRHLAILAMTGGGKTVAARRIIRELIRENYPLLILDPHGDYVGLSQCRDALQRETPGCEISIFFPDLLIQKDGEDLVTKLISQMTSGLSEPQMSYLLNLFDRKPAPEAEPALSYITLIRQTVQMDLAKEKPPGGLTGNWKGTVGAVNRALRIVEDKLGRMKATSERLRKSSKLQALPFSQLPSPFSAPEQIISPGKVSILYLGGYDHVTQCSIAAITLEALFDFRANLTDRIPPFMTVIEEAHTFIPSSREAGSSDAVSLPVVRRVITEGRKFGTGLTLISQRPSRLDETIVSQCNSFLILRLVNPRDQNFVRSIMENLTEADARMIPGFGPGQGIVSGQAVRFPLPVKIRMDTDLLASEIGDEDFFEQLKVWNPDKHSETREDMRHSMKNVRKNRRRIVRRKAKT